jgi:protein SCO1/2
MSKNLLTIILFSVVLFLSVYSIWRISQPRILSAEEMKVNGYFGYGSFEELRDFNLVDHNGDVFTKKNLKEQSLNFLYFGYSSCPTECPVMMSVMKQVFEKIETNDISYYLISFDPEIDTLERLRNYVTAFNPDFVGVSGDVPEVVKLGYQLGVEKLAPVENHMNQRIISHTNHLIVVNSEAEVIGIFKAPFESSAMSLVIKSLLASQ